jgi:hypothetical protein
VPSGDQRGDEILAALKSSSATPPPAGTVKRPTPPPPGPLVPPRKASISPSGENVGSEYPSRDGSTMVRTSSLLGSTKTIEWAD